MRCRRGFALLTVAVLAIAAAGACTEPGGGGTGGDGGGGGGQAMERTVRYGPYRIPGVNQPATGPFALMAPFIGGQAGSGTVWNQPVVNIEKPCTNCYITEISANLKTASGEVANVHNGLWLHHMVLLASGNGRRDPTCASGLHQVAVGRSGTAERIFASGNERTVVRMDGGTGRYGYQVETGTQFHMIFELMNLMHATAQQAYIELSYKYKTGGVRDLQPIWLDANGCGVSEVPARTGAYSIGTNTWRSTVSGPILQTGGHLHDGGTHMTIEKNGRVICDSVAGYGETPDYRPGGGGMDHDDGGDHGHVGAEGSLSSMSTCENVGDVNVGDTLHGTGYYDDSQHEQMVHDGRLHTVMAIGLVYIGQ